MPCSERNETGERKNPKVCVPPNRISKYQAQYSKREIRLFFGYIEGEKERRRKRRSISDGLRQNSDLL